MSEVTDSPVNWVAEHTRRYVESGGEDGHEWRPGVPTLLLTTTGRKSGTKRRTALIYGRDNADYVVVASQGGAPTHPAWFLNLQADPAVEIQVFDTVVPATARRPRAPSASGCGRSCARSGPRTTSTRRRRTAGSPSSS